MTFSIDRLTRLHVSVDRDACVGTCRIRQGDLHHPRRFGDDRTRSKRVRRDRHDDHAAEARCDDRSTGRQGVGGRAGGCRDDERIGTSAQETMTVDRQIERNDSARGASAHDDLVERTIRPDRSTVHQHLGDERGPALDLHVAGERRLDGLTHRLGTRTAQKPQPPELDSEQRNVDIAEQVYRLEDGAVAAERDCQYRFTDLGSVLGERGQTRSPIASEDSKTG